MDEIKFQEADLVTKYQAKQDAFVDKDGDGDEHGDEDDVVLANGDLRKVLIVVKIIIRIIVRKNI